MKMNYINKLILIIPALLLISCHDDLDQKPIDPDSFTETDVFVNATEAKGALAKLYASLALTGQQGATGQPDITGIDEGTSQYSRMLFNLNELTTDNAVVGWGDPGLPNLHALSWGASNDFITAMYFRLGQEVSFCNSFIENSQSLTDAEVEFYIAEARFLRAFTYYNLIDFYANVPLSTKVSTSLPEQSTRTELFNFVESELLEIQERLKESGTNEYGRVDRVAAWALLSKLYLNAEVWTGENRYTDAVTYAKKTINSTYSIHTTDANGNGNAYDDLFLADNDANGAQEEFIFTLNFDGNSSRTYGGTSFLIHAAIGGSMDPSLYGINGGWEGLRTTKALVNKFDYAISNSENGDPIAWEDNRAMFYTQDQNLEINTIANTFSDGYAVTKFTNIDSNGDAGSDQGGDFADTDLPIIRLAEIYLNYAEAVLRGGSGGDLQTATAYINELRERAFGGSSNGNISSSDLTLDFIIDERARELYWEGQRRTDLIRYQLFTTNTYLWPFKGDIQSGTGVEAYKTIFPIPSNIILTNENLTQNTGY
ncbi:RagB/SusD family nutrient uptake outer membrane protein [Mesonia aestuariivivens]|uniref:RagB/SusD family nutrient uptake outer membrane protein n=1 Tax=Mesonia aestuariivivens TaxID=2796128 RepID=A0ABS6W3U0_9FLAO|nr:RagB/SusD family nutrient uptake outer membrane protein [Mesonia aestuariivivens]MBW2962484.1 RagB/SusD family nutrient uptake outer membrane protein [Mesonia aestuariivivens]